MFGHIMDQNLGIRSAETEFFEPIESNTKMLTNYPDDNQKVNKGFFRIKIRNFPFCLIKGNSFIKLEFFYLTNSFLFVKMFRFWKKEYQEYHANV